MSQRALGPQFSKSKTYTVDVGFTTSRPVKPDEHTSRVTVAADDHLDAQWLATAMVSGRHGVEMPTSSHIVSWSD